MTIDNGATLTMPALTSPLITGSAGTNHATKVDVQSQYQAVVAGLLAYYQPGDLFQLKAGTFTRDELITEIQQFVAGCEKTKEGPVPGVAGERAGRAGGGDEDPADAVGGAQRDAGAVRQRRGAAAAVRVCAGEGGGEERGEQGGGGEEGAGDEGGEGDQGEEAEDGDQGVVAPVI